MSKDEMALQIANASGIRFLNKLRIFHQDAKIWCVITGPVVSPDYRNVIQSQEFLISSRFDLLALEKLLS